MCVNPQSIWISQQFACSPKRVCGNTKWISLNARFQSLCFAEILHSFVTKQSFIIWWYLQINEKTPKQWLASGIREMDLKLKFMMPMPMIRECGDDFKNSGVVMRAAELCNGDGEIGLTCLEVGLSSLFLQGLEGWDALGRLWLWWPCRTVCCTFYSHLCLECDTSSSPVTQTLPFSCRPSMDTRREIYTIITDLSSQSWSGLTLKLTPGPCSLKWLAASTSSTMRS